MHVVCALVTYFHARHTASHCPCAPRGRRVQVTYFRRALKLNQHFLSAWTLMGHEYVELKSAGRLKSLTSSGCPR